MSRADKNAYQRRYSKTAKGRATKRRSRTTRRGLATIARTRAKHNKAGRRREKFVIRELIAKLKSVPCMDCGGVFDPVCMDFDHRPDEVKLFSIGARKTSRNILLAEIAKCDVVCSNCHRLRTHRLRDHRLTRGPAKMNPSSTQLVLFSAEAA